MSHYEYEMRSISGILKRHSGTESGSESLCKNNIFVKVLVKMLASQLEH